ncbi:lactate dehydrogenase [Clostridium sp. SHJSY1]|uniref:NAD(P)-dependent oxidoreductase n=1 Tax=Clostridium sp. SHJSY1 TaxID=2942483 RepID=UPI002876CEE2|nr:NAD(P)-dependent oxidoreductase [Clostridium sp. SHJSY1]MDS0526477.1 lactate dehydrogenase [Clostridium sp. SHJSY1]
MGKIIIYNAREDEKGFIKKYKEVYNLDIQYIDEELNIETAIKAKGAEAVTVPGSNIVDSASLKVLSENGIKFLAVRSAGYNNIDAEAAKEYGIRFSNVSYSSNSVADFTTMLILMCVRKVKQIMERNDVQDYTLAGIQGKEMRNLTIGIIGTGKIGATVARNLSGFNCKIIAYDVYENDELRDVLEYVSLDKLFEKSDVITLHAPLFESNFHMINRESIQKMKDGVCIVNCGRGPLIDTEALIEGIESGKIGSAGLDVIEGELSVFHTDHRFNILNNHNISILRAFPNVIITPHAAFYTDQAVSDMVENALKSLESFMNTGNSPWEIKE